MYGVVVGITALKHAQLLKLEIDLNLKKGIVALLCVQGNLSLTSSYLILWCLTCKKVLYV